VDASFLACYTNEILVDNMQMSKTFIKNEQHLHSQGNLRTHSNQQKKQRLTTEKMDRLKPMKVEQAWHDLSSN